VTEERVGSDDWFGELEILPTIFPINAKNAEVGVSSDPVIVIVIPPGYPT